MSIPKEKRKRAAAMYAAGMAPSAIAQELGVLPQWVSTAVRAEGGTVRPRGHQRTVAQARLPLRPADYCILEAAATTALRRLGLPHWPKEDLVDVGWERVFFYAESYAQFERYGYLHAIGRMIAYVQAELQFRRRDLGTGRLFSEIAEDSDYMDHATPRCVLAEDHVWSCRACGHEVTTKPEQCRKCGGGAFEPGWRLLGQPVEAPAEAPDVEYLLNKLDREELALVRHLYWRGRDLTALGRARGVTRNALRRHRQNLLSRLRIVALVERRRHRE